MLEEAKGWPGWENLKTVAHTVDDGRGNLRISILSIASPVAGRLLTNYGDFFIIDCTFKLTKYMGRHTIVMTLVDYCGKAHPSHVNDVPGE